VGFPVSGLVVELGRSFVFDMVVSYDVSYLSFDIPKRRKKWLCRIVYQLVADWLLNSKNIRVLFSFDIVEIRTSNSLN